MFIFRAVAIIFVVCLFASASPSSATGSLSDLPMQTVPSSSFSSQLRLPKRSDIISILSNYYNQRNLVEGDEKLSGLNEVFSTIELALPDAQVNESGLDLTISNIVCSNLNVADIQISQSDISNTVQRLGIEVSGVQLTCTFRWEYSWSFFSGTGDGTVTSDPSSSISVDIDFLSKDFETQPPHAVSIKNCNPNLQIATLSVESDGSINIMGGIISLFKSLVTDKLEEELRDVVCDQLYELDDEGEIFDDMLTMLDEKIDELAGTGGDDLALEVTTDPLSAEKSANVPMDENGESLWVNFLEVERFVQDLVGLDLSELVETVLSTSSSSSSSALVAIGKENKGELAINSFMRETVLNKDGLLLVNPSGILDGDGTELFELHDLFTQTTMSIQSISIQGLDSFTSMDVLNPIGNYTLQNALELEYLTLLLEMEAVIKPSSKSDAVVVAAKGEAAVVKETFTIEFTFNDVDIDFALLLGLNTATLGSIPLGTIGFTENILTCILGAVDAVEFSTMSVTVADMTSPSLSGFLDTGMDHIITTGAEAIFGMYEPALIKALPKMFEATLRDMLNEYVADALENKKECPTPDDALVNLMDYRDLLLSPENSTQLLGSGKAQYGDLYPTMYGFLDEIMSSVDDNGLSWLNNLIVQLSDDLTLDGEGNILFPGDLVRQTLKVSLNGLNAAIEFAVSDVTVSNLDSLGALQLLQPTYGESSIVNNTASVGVGPDPLRLKMTILIKGKGDKVAVHNKFVLSLSLKDMSMLLVVLAQMQEPLFMNFPVGDVFSIDCWLATIVAPALDQYGIRVDGQTDTGLMIQKLAVVVAQASFDLNCISCSSPKMSDLEAAMQSPEGIEDTTETINRILEYGIKLLGGDYVQSEIDRMLNEAPYHCPHSPSYQQDFPGLEYEKLEPIAANETSYDFLFATIGVIAAVAVLSTLIFLIVRWTSRRRHNRWMKTLTRPQKLELQRMQKNERDQEKELNKQMTALVLSEEVPCLVRLFIPIVILGNIALFVSGHLSLGGTVYIAGSFAGDEFVVDNFFEFSMVQSTIDMWKAGAQALAILIAIFSGFWPYAKQVTTLVIWLTPPNNCCFCGLSAKRRGNILHWLDVLGKWSMVDIFVLLLTLASFRLSISSPDHLAFLPDLYNVEMMVQPKWGLYANMLAQLVAQLSSHVVIHYHRKTVRSATKSQDNELNNLTVTQSPDLDTKVESSAKNSNAKQRLLMHEFKQDYEASDKNAIVHNSFNWILFAASLAFIALVICGCSLPSFNVEILGIVGLAIESGNQWRQAKTYYSVFDLANMIVDQARYIDQTTDYLGLGTLASILVITVFIIPLAQAASLLAQWFAPMTEKQRKWNTVLNEILSAWQYMEVYVLSIIIAAWQLGDISDFMINAYCGALQDTFDYLSNFGILEKEDAQCFRVEATVETASWLLVAASLILGVLNHFIGAAASQKKQDDNTLPEMRLHTDRWLASEAPQETTRAVVYENEEDEMSDESPAGNVDSNDKVNVTPISPRFTDYYCFATTPITTTTTIQQLEQSIEQGSQDFDILPTPIPVPMQQSQQSIGQDNQNYDIEKGEAAGVETAVVAPADNGDNGTDKSINDVANATTNQAAAAVKSQDRRDDGDKKVELVETAVVSK